MCGDKPPFSPIVVAERSKAKSAANRLLELLVRIPPAAWKNSDPSSRNVLPPVVCHCVRSGNLKNEAALARVGLSRQRKERTQFPHISEHFV